MKILSIETSCDETAVSVVEANGGLTEPYFHVLGNALFSQIKMHAEFGGVVPTLAKREHARNLPPLLIEALTQTDALKKTDNKYSEETWRHIETILAKENNLYPHFREALEHIARPDIDCITVTAGPGLEPALWVGISFALALGKLWTLPVIPANHMEGHIASVLMNVSGQDDAHQSLDGHHPFDVQFPAVALLISGGHTEIVSVTGWGKYEVIGQTRDDAVGEAFDKVARLLGLPYPGGPEISRLAEMAREQIVSGEMTATVHLPRPMIHSGDLNFSFSGLKTAVLYYIRDYVTENKSSEQTDPLPLHSLLPLTKKIDIAREFEDAVADVLLAKTTQALDEIGAQTLIVAGGVISNKKLRETFTALENEYAGLRVKIPVRDMATDNAVMIACAAYLQTQLHPELLSEPQKNIIAQGNLKL